MWKYRTFLRSIHSKSLVKLLSAVRWADVKMVKQVYGLLELWGPLPPLDALEVRNAPHHTHDTQHTHDPRLIIFGSMTASGRQVCGRQRPIGKCDHALKHYYHT